MDTEKVIELIQCFSPLEMKIIRLVAANWSAEEIARETGLQKVAMQQHIAIIYKHLQEVKLHV